MTSLGSREQADVLVDVRDHVAWVTLNRPEVRNALSMSALAELADIFETLADDRSTRVIVLTGQPDADQPAFAAGGDIREFEALDNAEAVIAYQDLYRRLGHAIESCGQPTIAAIAGPCVGGGAVIATTCDLRIAAPSARFGIPVARTLGNCMNQDDFLRLVNAVGDARARELLFTARLIDAPTMETWGLVCEVTASDADLLPAADRLACRLTASSPLTMSTAKEMLRRVRAEQKPPTDGDDLVLRCFLSSDFRHAVASFQSGERPTWIGE